jgi:hypothetical protein
MTEIGEDVHGFIAKTEEHDPGIMVRIPGKAQEFDNLEKDTLLDLTLRTKTAETDVSRKLIGSGNGLKFYLPKSPTNTLGLEPGDTLQVFYRKK